MAARRSLTGAAYTGYTEIVAALLAAPGIDVNAADEEGHTALIKATGKDYTEIVAALLASPGIERRMWAESRE